MRAELSVLVVATSVMLGGCGMTPPSSTHEAHHHEGAHGGAALGEVSFDTTCAREAHAVFNKGMLYQHSFWYRASRQEFEKALAIDPGCAIAYWGIAQSLLLNPFGPPPPASLPEGLALLERAERIGTSQRERDFIAALKAFYSDHQKRDHRTRVQAYLQAMAEVAKRHPADDEAQIYYALALNVAASPSDKTYALPLQAAALLEPIMRRRPTHPGVAHYLVHSYDFPPIAHKGIDAAKRYAQIAGASPHALHMPSHIFTRVGHWDESVAANLKSAEVARADKEPDDELHAMDYMVYAYLQQAKDGDAAAVIARMSAVSGVNEARHTGPFAIAAASARHAIERGDWNGAADLPVRQTRFAHVDAITQFARALGAARTGRIDAAKSGAARLAELQDKLKSARDGYWAEQVAISHDVVRAWIARAEGKRDEAVRMLQAAADAEDRTDKHVVTPGPLVPARELLASMLLADGRAADALDAFEATLRKEPRRLNATLGAANAARAVGNRDLARRYFEDALRLAARNDTTRRELQEAREFVRQ